MNYTEQDITDVKNFVEKIYQKYYSNPNSYFDGIPPEIEDMDVTKKPLMWAMLELLDIKKVTV